MRKQFVIAIIFLLSCFSVVVCGQTYKDVTTSHSGELASLLGEDTNGIDSLVVRGPINSDDFYTMWQASFLGNLSVINLENANVENGIVPKNAFWHQSEQLEPDGQYIDCIRLRRIIFPEGVVEIGNGAFSYCIYLEEINIPSTLRRLNKYSFSECIRLKTDPLVFPEGMEEIADLAFLNCRSLTGEVVLPSTMKTIGNGSFFSCKITNVNLPEGLREIGNAAFYACRLKEIHIPNSCLDLTGSSHVQLNLGLEKIHLPEGITTIPSLFACYCRDLKEVNIPASVKVIKNSAFEYCKPLRFLCLPEGLERIEGDAFYYVSSLEEVVFPSTLKSLGDNAFAYCTNLKNVFLLGVTTIEAYKRIFDQCSNIVKISLPVIQTIKNNSLFLIGSTKLSEIDLGPNVTTIGTNFISGNNTRQLDRFICRAQTPPTFNKLYKNPKAVYVPYSADHSILNAYKNATN